MIKWTMATLLFWAFVGTFLAACETSPTPARVLIPTSTERPLLPATVRPLPAPTERPLLPATVRPLPTPAREPTQSKYLPLSSGNKWVYRKTVLRKVFAWQAYGKVGQSTVTFARGTPPNILPGESEETFTVTDKVEENGLELWKIAVSSPTARDGRYGSWLTTPDTILWGRVPSSEHVIEIDEILVSQSVFEGERRHRGILLVETLVKGTEATLQSLKPVKFVASAKSVDAEVPAGRFKGCLEITMKVEGTGDQEGWTTYSYYAAAVGLVRELQKDDRNNTTYILELIRYELK